MTTSTRTRWWPIAAMIVLAVAAGLGWLRQALRVAPHDPEARALLERLEGQQNH